MVWGDSMAINVTTWTQLVNELKRLHADDEDVVINLMNDIDMNDGYASGVSTTQIKCFGRSMILNGNGHCIRNLRTSISNPQPIFSMADYHYSANVPLRISNLDFVNLICAGADFLQDSASYRYVQLTNCRFVGYRTGNSYLIGQDAYINCISCESYGGWTIINSPDVKKPDVPTTSCCMFAMNGCYINGQVKLPLGYFQNGPSYYSNAHCYVYRANIGSYYTASTPNVIDVDWISDFSGMGYKQYLTCYVLNMNAVFKKSMATTNYNSIGWSRSSAGSQPDIILATPEQMGDVEWLRSQGFPIIDPTPIED